LRALRESEARRAVSILGLPVSRLHFLGLRDTAAPRCGPAFHKAVASISHLMRTYDCELICAPWLHDPHSDHEAAHLIARAVANVTSAKLLSYPVWGWLLPEETDLPDERISGWRLDIAAHMGAKRRAVAAHVSQYTDLISDDPNAFRLSTKLLSAMLDRPYEVLLRSL
jgi:LmbE family N-acetylglucosaminyl deacetylase